MNPRKQVLTIEEENQLDWCYATLEEENACECEEEGMAIAAKEYNEPLAAEILVRLCAKIHLHRLQNGGSDQ